MNPFQDINGETGVITVLGIVCGLLLAMLRKVYAEKREDQKDMQAKEIAWRTEITEQAGAYTTSVVNLTAALKDVCEEQRKSTDTLRDVRATQLASPGGGL